MSETAHKAKEGSRYQEDGFNITSSMSTFNLTLHPLLLYGKKGRYNCKAQWVSRLLNPKWVASKTDEEENYNRFLFSPVHMALLLNHPGTQGYAQLAPTCVNWVDICCIMHIKARISQKEDVTAEDINILSLAVSSNVFDKLKSLICSCWTRFCTPAATDKVAPAGNYSSVRTRCKIFPHGRAITQLVV